MSTPFKPAGPNEYADFTPRDTAAPPEQGYTADNPPWGVPGGGGLWLASVALMAIFPLLFLVPYLLRQRLPAEQWNQVIVSDPTAIFLQIISTVPAHLLTLGIAWLIVTRAGRHPFFPSLGWGWTRGINRWTSPLLAAGLLLIGIGILYLTGDPEAPLDKLLKSSRQTALATAFIATFTAPLVEEVVYRGVLYSGLRKHLGSLWAGLFVVLLFAVVHVPQYWPSYGRITVILLLSAVLTLVRARTGKLLPCVAIHTVFNGIQSAFIVAQPYLDRYLPETPPTPAPDPALVLRLFGIF